MSENGITFRSKKKLNPVFMGKTNHCVISPMGKAVCGGDHARCVFSEFKVDSDVCICEKNGSICTNVRAISNAKRTAGGT